MADDHMEEDGHAAAGRTFTTTLVGAVLFILACAFVMMAGGFG